MKKKAVSILLVLTTICAVALSGCSGDKKADAPSTDHNASSEPLDGGSITVGIAQDLEDSLDPHRAVAAGTKEVLFNLFEGLVRPDENGDLQPAVASDYKVSDDGLTYTFTLRDGVKFHNGNDVTAEDVKYSIDRCADTSAGDPLVSAFSVISSVDVVDERTVEIKLTEANSEFLSYMTTAIIPKDYEEQASHPIGTGPFMYVSRSPQENIVIKKFGDYWGTPAYLDEVTFKIVADADTVVTNLKGGSIDMYARLTSSQAAELSSGFTIYEGTMNLVQALYLNNQEKPFDNEKVRQALCYTIDPQEIMDMIADGKGVRVGSAMYPGFEKYFDKDLGSQYTVDYEKAKKLLKEAGYPDGFEMTITVPSNYQPHIDTAQVIVEELKNIGVKATIKTVEWDSWLSDVYGNHKYQSTVVGVDAATLTARAMLERYTTGNGGNFVNYSNTEYDKLFEKASGATDEKEQIDAYKQMEQILSEDAASVYIQDMANLVALSDSYGGYTFYPIYVQDMSKIYRVK